VLIDMARSWLETGLGGAGCALPPDPPQAASIASATMRERAINACRYKCMLERYRIGRKVQCYSLVQLLFKDGVVSESEKKELVFVMARLRDAAK
jgi:hypothetical protein